MQSAKAKEGPKSHLSTASAVGKGEETEAVTPESKTGASAVDSFGSASPTPTKSGIGAKLGRFIKGNIPVFLMMAK
jgi:hypothetical protein